MKDTMKKLYRVRWIEHHMAEVEAESGSMARTLALVDPASRRIRISFKIKVIQKKSTRSQDSILFHT